MQPNLKEKATDCGSIVVLNRLLRARLGHHLTALCDVDPGPWDPCVVAAMEKFTWTTEILSRKGTAWPLFK